MRTRVGVRVRVRVRVWVRFRFSVRVKVHELAYPPSQLDCPNGHDTVYKRHRNRPVGPVSVGTIVGTIVGAIVGVGAIVKVDEVDAGTTYSLLYLVQGMHMLFKAQDRRTHGVVGSVQG